MRTEILQKAEQKDTNCDLFLEDACLHRQRQRRNVERREGRAAKTIPEAVHAGPELFVEVERSSKGQGATDAQLTIGTAAVDQLPEKYGGLLKTE